MGYKLADGSDSELYKKGDAFIATNSAGEINRGAIMHFSGKTKVCDDFTHFLFNGLDDYNWDWSSLTPTEETKRKVAERNKPKCKFDKDKLADEPLARIIDWRGGEKPQFGDLLVSHDNGMINLITRIDGETLWCANMGELKVGVKFDPKICSLIRINTAAIPKHRTMTRAEVEREFCVKVVD